MAYYTERHTMREPVKKTYDISVDVYTLIFLDLNNLKYFIGVGNNIYPFTIGQIVIIAPIKLGIVKFFHIDIIEERKA